jgi:hypothetical protein
MPPTTGQHTPGVWKVSKIKPEQVPTIGIDVPGKHICMAGVYCTGPRHRKTAEANARLIAAAPRYAAEVYNLLFAWEHDSETTLIRESIERLKQIHKDATGEEIA